MQSQRNHKCFLVARRLKWYFYSNVTEPLERVQAMWKPNIYKLYFELKHD